MADYPRGCERSIELAGQTLFLRPIRAADYEREIEFARHLSAQSVYSRFFSPLPELPEMLAHSFVEVDYRETMALIALEGDEGLMAGVARYGATGVPRECEFAVTIADRWQRKGLGRILLSPLIDYARTAGFARMVGMIQSDNAGMRALATGLGFSLHISADDGSVIVASRALS